MEEVQSPNKPPRQSQRARGQGDNMDGASGVRQGDFWPALGAKPKNQASQMEESTISSINDAQVVASTPITNPKFPPQERGMWLSVLQEASRSSSSKMIELSKALNHLYFMYLDGLELGEECQAGEAASTRWHFDGQPRGMVTEDLFWLHFG